jgi:hypothetical protein
MKFRRIDPDERRSDQGKLDGQTFKLKRMLMPRPVWAIRFFLE